jgi:hypothetical protein
MPSQARKRFDKNAIDIERLMKLHQEKGGALRGRRRGLEVLNKSAIILITSFWEAYCEDIAAESLEYIVKYGVSPESLPKEIKQLVAKELKSNLNELAVWSLCGDGWREILKSRLKILQEQRNNKLNTPKTENIDDLFAKTLGLSSVSSSWRWANKMTAKKASKKLDKYVTLRCEIAHRGIAAKTVTKAQVEDYSDFIKKAVSKTEDAVKSHVGRITGKPLWGILRRKQNVD